MAYSYGGYTTNLPIDRRTTSTLFRDIAEKYSPARRSCGPCRCHDIAALPLCANSDSGLALTDGSAPYSAEALTSLGM
jgi:hypothetical protein